MTRARGFGTVVLVLCVTAAAAMGATDRRIARIAKMSGDVRIIRLRQNEIRPGLVDKEVKGGALISTDEIRTTAGSSATVVFNDGSTLGIGPEAKISINEVGVQQSGRICSDGAAKVVFTDGTKMKVSLGAIVSPEGKGRYASGRRIRIHRMRTVAISLGKVVWDAKRNEKTVTKFELPNSEVNLLGGAGTFDVETEAGQTQVGIRVESGSPTLPLFIGRMTVAGKSHRVLAASLGQGQAVSYQVVGATARFSVLEAAKPAAAMVTTFMPHPHEAKIKTCGKAAAVMEVRVPKHGMMLYVRVRQGEVELTDPYGSKRTLRALDGEFKLPGIIPSE